jgi:hypothetical protein
MSASCPDVDDYLADSAALTAITQPILDACQPYVDEAVRAAGTTDVVFVVQKGTAYAAQLEAQGRQYGRVSFLCSTHYVFVEPRGSDLTRTALGDWFDVLTPPLVPIVIVDASLQYVVTYFPKADEVPA